MKRGARIREERARYSNMSGIAALGFLINGMDERKDDDGDTGSAFPRSDAEDMSKGARFVPGEVTLARRAGKKVNFVTICDPNCWYWEMPDGSRFYHYEPLVYRHIGLANGREEINDGNRTYFKDGPGHCPRCGNINTRGGVVKVKP